MFSPGGPEIVLGLFISKFLISYSTDPEFSTVAKSVSYESLARIAWSVALSVQIFACQAGFGGWINSFLTWNWLQPFSRLTYGVYLLHFGIASALITQLRHPFYYQTDFEVVSNNLIDIN